MIVKNNYDKCLTNFACSIRKYFELEYHHKTLKEVDDLLERYQPENVVVLLFDGMGSRILKRTLEEESFFRKHQIEEITTVFPATTTAATTSMKTGLNPVEHGWLGWNTYLSPIKKTITLFRDCEKAKTEVCMEFVREKERFVSKTIVKEINENKKFQALEISPFGDHPYENLEDMFHQMEEETKKKGKKYIYVYDEEPDATMHLYGSDHLEVRTLIEKRSKKLEELCSRLKNTIIFVVADHGHITAEPIYLKDYPDILDMLERTTSIEPRAVSFKVKEGKQKQFVDIFQKTFGNYFSLYTKKEVMDSKLFGDGKECEWFEEAIGDYLAIAEHSNKYLVDEGDHILYSQHAGYTDDEIYVPLIMWHS